MSKKIKYSELLCELGEKKCKKEIEVIYKIQKIKEFPTGFKAIKKTITINNYIEKNINGKYKDILKNILLDKISKFSWYNRFSILNRINEKKDKDLIKILDWIESKNNNWKIEDIEELEEKIEEYKENVADNEGAKIKNINILNRKLKGLIRKKSRGLPKEFGEALKRIREEELGLSLQELSQISGVSASYINRLEKSENVNPSSDIIKNIAMALGTYGKELLQYLQNFELKFKCLSDIIYSNDFYVINEKKITKEQKKDIIALLNIIYVNNIDIKKLINKLKMQ